MSTRRLRLRLRLVPATLAALWLALLAPACDREPPGQVTLVECDDATDTRVCVADPDPRWVTTEGCYTDTHCPTGSTCDRELEPREAAEGVCTDTDWEAECGEDCDCEGLHATHGCDFEDPGACRLATAEDYDPSALTDVFGNRSLVLEQTYDSETGFVSLSWQATGDVDDYVVVACKLYGCPPVVQDCCPSPDPECRDNDPVPCITNYDRCVLASKETPGSAGTFDLGGTEYRYEPDLDGSCTYGGGSGAEAPLGRREAMKSRQLLVGCLAYADTEVRAASELLAVDPSRVHPELSRVRPAADCPEHTGEACDRTDSEELGTCAEGECRPRCVEDADCEAGSCARAPLEFVGTCQG